MACFDVLSKLVSKATLIQKPRKFYFLKAKNKERKNKEETRKTSLPNKTRPVCLPWQISSVNDGVLINTRVFNLEREINAVAI